MRLSAVPTRRGRRRILHSSQNRLGGNVSYDAYHKRKIGQHVLKPETQMMGFGYDPALSEGSLKPPIFLTSTFVFKTAQEGKDFFDYTSGRREPGAGQTSGLVYSRFNNPNLEVLEDRYDQRSTVVTTQVPTKSWHEMLGDPTVADAICDRLVHNAHVLSLKGPSIRKKKGLEGKDTEEKG